MLAFALWFGMLWPAVAPLTIGPGMTCDHVEALLGKPATFVFYGSINGGAQVGLYPQFGLTVCYAGGRVKTVCRHKE